ncbi:CNNM domain-containing protein [Hellea sp.]|nr:CNNM domain-containing protein [Hellea sp.]
MSPDVLSPEVLLILKWLAIAFCISQSAMFSGLNLAYFSVSRLRLEVDAGTGNKSAARILAMREDSNFLLTTILWGNVGINVLLTLLSNSVMAGVSAFLFSTILITLFGEIFPQAYFSRNAMAVGAKLAPILRLYQILLYPVAKPVALLLDAWLGKETIQFLRERGMREMIRQHMSAEDSDLGHIEGLGALNFFSIDDVLASQEGEPLDPTSIIAVEFKGDAAQFPDDCASKDSKFLQSLKRSGRKWAVITDPGGAPRLAVDTDAYLRSALLENDEFDPNQYCHRPIVIKDTAIRLGHILKRFEVNSGYSGDNVIDRDIVLLWTDSRRIITGADILGRLLTGISKVS